jgi:hypothetical protein
MRTLISMLCFAIPLLALPSHGQEEQDPYSIATVRFEIRMRSGEGGVRHSFSQRQLVRLGDGISIALTKILDEQQMLDPETLGAILPMIREAFSQPELIVIKANRQPQITLLLLDHIRQKASEARVRDQIDGTIAFVKKHSD